MKFVVDVMLGRLARWLRILGYDTLYSPDYDDAELARIADREGRYLLTRDRELLTHYVLRYSFLVNSDDVYDQLRELRDELGVRVREGFLSRCILCNAMLREVDRSEIAHEVPAYVFHTAGSFHRCGGCGKIYWPGTHVVKMRERLKQIFDTPE
jgi:uncharacterized protein with PIN domain